MPPFRVQPLSEVSHPGNGTLHHSAKMIFKAGDCTTKGGFIAKQEGHSAAKETPLLLLCQFFGTGTVF